jgi:hypothetical protein
MMPELSERAHPTIVALTSELQRFADATSRAIHACRLGDLGGLDLALDEREALAPNIARLTRIAAPTRLSQSGRTTGAAPYLARLAVTIAKVEKLSDELEQSVLSCRDTLEQALRRTMREIDAVSSYAPPDRRTSVTLVR